MVHLENQAFQDKTDYLVKMVNKDSLDLLAHEDLMESQDHKDPAASQVIQVLMHQKVQLFPDLKDLQVTKVLKVNQVCLAILDPMVFPVFLEKKVYKVPMVNLDLMVHPGPVDLLDRKDQQENVVFVLSIVLWTVAYSLRMVHAVNGCKVRCDF